MSALNRVISVNIRPNTVHKPSLYVLLLRNYQLVGFKTDHMTLIHSILLNLPNRLYIVSIYLSKEYQ